MRQIEQQLHRDFPPTTVWGYEGQYPGPTIEARVRQPILIRYLNELPVTHLLPVDVSVHGADVYLPQVRTVVHLHDGELPADVDGHPEAWFTPGLTTNGPMFTTNLFRYPNRQRPTTLWYHDHAMGITRLNIYAGLAGFYLLRDENDARLELPSGPFELPLLLQDRSFNKDGSLQYPATIPPEFFGNTNLVNGKVWPFLEVEPRRYRFRLLNGANARFYNLMLEPAISMIQIGGDGGYLKRAAPVKEILLAPAERADVIIDFTGLEGATITMTNDAPTPFPKGTRPTRHTRAVMQFRVTLPRSGRDRSRIPRYLPAGPFPRLRDVVRSRDLILDQQKDHMGRQMSLLGIRDMHGRPMPLQWGDATTEKPRLGTVEIWRLINLTVDTHPIHLHLVRFHILDRQSFDVDRFRSAGELVFTGPAVPAAENERGMKDTVRANPGEVTRFAVRFGRYTGEFVWHCHILEHEDMEMMRRMEVIAEDSDRRR
ncbi:multicopper oxidase [Polyangium sp. 6x1]|uniref:multicopper oxidase family protein n=1 Tax=Polyangium sp. 6x1 TaxID=3042689 RepID=UPI002482C77B|nr:multicopper oxidase [Polyangium sp. 6x1]MDI1446769.1 multicopper oxidase [Polyangium sp. 6x1]